MNYTTAILLTDENVRAILVTYEAHENAARTLFKTIDATVKVGDYVVIPTDSRHKMTVAKVVEVDTDVDHDDKTPVGWIVQKFSKSEYEQIVAQEAEKMTQIKQIVANRKRESLRAALFNDDLEKLKALPINGELVNK